MKVVECEYVEINNISCIFAKMAAKMAAENLILMYISALLSGTKTNAVSIHINWKK